MQVMFLLIKWCRNYRKIACTIKFPSPSKYVPVIDELIYWRFWNSLFFPDPVDFIAHTELVSFDVAEEERTVTITINDDDIVESAEEFFVVLEVPPGETGVLLPQSFSTVTITDNDGKHTSC